MTARIAPISPTAHVQVTFRDLDRSDAIDRYVRSRAEKLATLGRNVLGCHVAIEVPHRSKHHGRHYRVRLDLAIPGGELVIDRCPDEGRACEDVYVAIDQAFDHAMRRLREGAQRRRDDHVRSGR
jgi:ribosomal subunit interface protein